jgi:hypothetical protein
MTDNNKPSAEPSEERRDQTNLSGRYGSIGIEAVAAAARYCGEAKSAPRVSAAPKVEERFLETAR